MDAIAVFPMVTPSVVKLVPDIQFENAAERISTRLKFAIDYEPLYPEHGRCFVIFSDETPDDLVDYLKSQDK